MSKYNCEKCNYSTNVKDAFSKHLLSKKHLSNDTNKNTCNTILFKCDCKKTYKTRNGLFKHTQKCSFMEKEKERIRNEEMEKKLNEILEILKKGDCQQLITNNNIQNTNSNNNEFNINVFLNDKCKNAINIMDFVRTITVDMEDAIKFKELGYVEAMTQIITNALMKHNLYDRPLHCIENYENNENEIHIRHRNIWNKEDEETPILDNAIEKIDRSVFDKIQGITKDSEIKTSLLQGSYTTVREDVKYDVLKNIITEPAQLIKSG
jgi:hypothetical protein